jgi:hypothetical protein
MTQQQFIYSTRDIKKLIELSQEGFIRLYIQTCQTCTYKPIYVACEKCNSVFSDNNSGRVLFNIKIHYKLKHRVEIE